MQLMADALTVFGSRFGIAINPPKNTCYLIKADDIKSFPFEIRAGVEIGDKIFYLPLCSKKPYFLFCEQDSTPTTIQLSGIDPESGLHLKLILRSTFKPRDVFRSTIPLIYLELEVKRLSGPFRWYPLNRGRISGRAFIEIDIPGASANFREEEKLLEISYEHFVRRPPESKEGLLVQDSNLLKEKRKSFDKLGIIRGNFERGKFFTDFQLFPGEEAEKIVLCWANYEEPILSVKGKKCEFKYTEYFKSVDEVLDWGRNNHSAVTHSSYIVDKIILSHNLGNSLSHLLVNTLHSWLFDTWYVKLPDGGDWYSVWEGSCYFHSTVDVEYTQSPFYLSVWPELLELELNEWPLFAKDGSKVLGKRGEGTLFISHDMGVLVNADRQYYPHEMEVEENVNYILMAYSLWRRTGNDRTIKKHSDFIKRLMDFVIACDTTGNGVVDKCCANTIDDASPAIQFGKEQIYLAVKSMAAISAGIEILKHCGVSVDKRYKKFVKNALRTIENQGWKEDHYVVTLTRSAEGLVDPWTNEKLSGELSGWDSYHIYTENGLVLLEMVGKRTGLDPKRIVADLINSTEHTLLKYGCRHSSYVPGNLRDAIKGLSGSSPNVGWISMNMVRDIVAGYYGVDLFSLAESYWDWQLTTNTQDIYLFFETFYGNNLNLYPRGLAIFGYFDGIAGFVYDMVRGIRKFKPIRANIEVPILLFADWDNGKFLKLKSYNIKGNIKYSCASQSV